MKTNICHEGQQICRRLHCRRLSLETVQTRCTAVGVNTRSYATAASASASSKQDVTRPQQADRLAKSPLGQRAQQKEADREFFADLLSSAATKRDAKAYLNRMKGLPKTKSTPVKPQLTQSGSYVNVGNLFRGSRAAEMSPVFSQSPRPETEFQDEETLHMALVKIKDVASLAAQTLAGVAETIAQLNRLSISPCVVVESSTTDRSKLREEVELLVDAINRVGDVARKVDNIFNTTAGSGVTVAHREHLMRPLRRGRVPVVANVAYNEDEQKICLVPINEAVLALTRELAGLSFKSPTAEGDEATSEAIRGVQKQVSLDRIITIDSAGGIPNDNAVDGKHVFLNLEQEYDVVKPRLERKTNSSAALTQISNLDLLKQALLLLPPSSSGLMTTHEEAANHTSITKSLSASSVGTRRSKNALIHNLLTDKPAYSSSLPVGRLGVHTSPTPAVSHSTFIKRGMPLTILPNPFTHPWTPTSPRITLTDPRINLPRLIHLIEDSFDRKLDVSDYLARVDSRIAGIVIAGDYEGGAILTWETPPSASSATSPQLQVPYLDKFAVLKRSQGAGGVADIVFNAMVRSCFPTGVCWRSRKDNPVNKWYFERSRGTWKIPDMNWTMFWTTEGVEQSGEGGDDVFRAYEEVCRGVKPSWADGARPAD